MKEEYVELATEIVEDQLATVINEYAEWYGLEFVANGFRMLYVTFICNNFRYHILKCNVN